MNTNSQWCHVTHTFFSGGKSGRGGSGAGCGGRSGGHRNYRHVWVTALQRKTQEPLSACDALWATRHKENITLSFITQYYNLFDLCPLIVCTVTAWRSICWMWVCVCGSLCARVSEWECVCVCVRASEWVSEWVSVWVCACARVCV